MSITASTPRMADIVRKAITDTVRRDDISQTEIARRAGISQAAISAFMRGHRGMSPPVAEQVLAVCGLELVYEVRPIGGTP